jgi:predicted nucleotidyltransferase/uncharacterized protein (UPF0332 family)
MREGPMNANYSNVNLPVDQEKMKKEFEKTKKELEKIKNFIIKKYKFIQSISILPPQSIKYFIEEEEVPKESEKHVHLNVIISDDKEKEIPKMKKEILKEVENSKEKVWLHIRTISEIWEICMDQKFEITGAISMSFPLYDKGTLGALRVAEIHKSLVLQKFERYVVSYVLGGSLIRGDAVKTSDIDVFVIINDTDVKRMSRLELRERLRGIIYQYVAEASSLAGVQNKLSPQIYLLTEFWEAVKDAHPVMFTFIRDGVPIYDRGTFMPWKSLLRMGKLKPSPESIDMFMSMGDKLVPSSKKFFLTEVFTNIFWGITTPAQAILMLNGCPPPNAKKELVREFKKEFLDKKMIEKKYINFLEKIVEMWRDYEHEKIKEISGSDIDNLLKESDEFIKRLKELRKQIEKKSQEKTIEQIYNDSFELLKEITGKKSRDEIVHTFEKDFVKKGKFTPQHLRILRNIITAKTEFKRGKLDSHKVDNARKDAVILINDLIEYSQRCDLISVDKSRIKIKTKDKVMELLNCDGASFLFDKGIVKKITNKIEDASVEEVDEAIKKQKDKKNVEINSEIFETLKKEFGNFEIIF